MAMRIICLAAGFAFGCIPSGYIIGRIKGVDVRKTGSGNVGATNVMRALGRGYGALTMVFDMLKAIIPIIIMLAVFGGDTGTRYLVTMYAGLGAVIGHDYSPFLKFNGGKGIATSGGMLLMSDPRLFLINLVAIFGLTIATGYVSLGSLTACVIYFVFHLASVIAGFTLGWGFYPQYYDPSHTAEVLILAAVFSSLAAYRHRGNIGRLISGTEHKISLRGKKKSAA